MAQYIDSSRTKTLRTGDGTHYSYYHSPPTSANKLTILLLHGFPSSAYDWRHLIPLLSTAGFGIVAPDLLGYGGTDKPSDPQRYRLKVISSHVNDILEHEKLDKVFAIAHDWGSGLLSRLLLYHPNRFLGCSFISVPYLPPAPLDIDAINDATKESLGWEIFGYWDVLKLDNAAALIENSYPAYESLTWAGSKEDVKDHMGRRGGLAKYLSNADNRCKTADWISKSEIETSSKLLLNGGFTGPTCWYKQSVRRLGDADEADFSDEAKKLKLPVHFVATLNDVLCVPQVMLGITTPWVENLTVEEIQAGHWVLMEKPQELADKILGFINGLAKI